MWMWSMLEGYVSNVGQSKTEDKQQALAGLHVIWALSIFFFLLLSLFNLCVNTYYYSFNSHICSLFLELMVIDSLAVQL